VRSTCSRTKVTASDFHSARRPLDEIPKLTSRYPGHVELPRMRDGGLGAAFFTVWTPCPATDDFDAPNDMLRDALEVLDFVQNMISQQPEHLQFARSSADIRHVHEQRKIAALIGAEGMHFLGNSLSIVRLLAQAGARYMPLTHVCHSAFASSNGAGDNMKMVHPSNGLYG
jgi:membrane dipeptidase